MKSIRVYLCRQVQQYLGTNVVEVYQERNGGGGSGQLSNKFVKVPLYVSSKSHLSYPPAGTII